MCLSTTDEINMAKAPKRQPRGLEWPYTAEQGTSDYTSHLWFVTGPDIESNVSSESKEDIETICAAMNFAVNFDKLRKVAETMETMLEQIQEFK